MQRSKFIDLTRTFLPVDPNTFPNTLHGTDREDSPENRIPVMAYEGHNFLPTHYGYKSYFGTNSELEIDALTANVDYILMYQNTNFENILIALTDSGIWIKRAATTGAWTQLHTVVPDIDPNVHYEWTYVVISQVLYCYQQNKPNYQKIVSDIAAGVVLTNVVPNTLNMAAQMGIFRAGGRLGFWDSDDSISWSNQDNYADFVTAVLTLAGSQKFIDLNGRIVTIRGHGPGFMIYATKSILFVYPSSDATMQWAVNVIFSNNGIVYPRMCVADSPDTTHYAYTDSGLYKIENAKEEPIITEVTDTLAQHAGPIYLSFQEGRYLFLEIMDPDFLEGQVQFAEGTAEAITYVWPAASSLQGAVDEEILNGTNMCATIDAMSNGNYMTPPSPGDQKPGTPIKPMWTAYLSMSGIKNADNVTWTNTPQATIDPNGVEANQCPAGNGNKTSQLTTDSTNKTAVTGAAAYIDGIWTMQRFVQTQEALWEMEEKEIEKWFNKVLARGKTVVKDSYSATDPNVPMTVNKGLIGTYVAKFTKGIFTFSPCEMRLTRYCIAARELYRIKKNIVVGTDTTTVPTSLGFSIAPAGNNPGSAWGGINATPLGALQATYPSGSLVYYPYVGSTTCNQYTNLAYNQLAIERGNGQGSGAGPYGIPIFEIFQIPTGWSYENPGWLSNAATYSLFIYNSLGRWTKKETMIAVNAAYDIAIGPIPDVAYATRTGWSYTNTSNAPATVGAAACADAQIDPGKPNNTPQIGLDGSFCSIPFQPVTIPGVPELGVGWPETEITLPPSTFLLQNGSIAPVYPTMQGALVYDLKLKKWGKYKGLYKCLLNYQPINNSQNGVVPFNSFGILSGILAVGGKIKLFDAYPSDSYITYGKIGYSRLGITTAEEVIVHFASQSTGYVKLDTSISGRFYDPFLSKSLAYVDAASVRLTGGFPGRWHNITISGTYDINYLEYRGFKQGSR